MKHYLQYIQDVTVRKWDEDALTDYRGKGFTYAQMAAKVGQFHTFYRSLGLEPGCKIAICGLNSCRWAVALIANQSFGGVSVPILYDFTPEAIVNLCDHSESAILFTEKAKFAKMDLAKAPGLQVVIDLADYSCLWAAKPEYKKSLDQAMWAGDDFIDDRLPFAKGRTLDELAVINYTSGTTGEPKGVMLTSRAISANVVFGLQNDPVQDTDKSLSMLPMAHMYGLAFEFLYSFCGGSHIYFLGKTPSPSTLMAAFAEVKPYIMVTVPLVMEKLVKSKIMPVLSKPAMKVATAIPGVNCIIYRTMRRKLMDAFGGNICEIPLGGAALNPDVEKVLRKMKVPFTVGYGMTECAPLVCYTKWSEFKPGSCGRPLAGLNQIRIDSPDPYKEVGEVQVTGENVMLGYYKNPTATAAAFTEDGWLRTGDLGIIGKDGTLYLKGRSKCMILSSNGQNIYPEEIEAMFNSQPEVEESLVVSREGKITALLSLVEGLQADTNELLKNIVDRVNAHLPMYSRVAATYLMTEPFVHTPKHSIKRSLYQ